MAGYTGNDTEHNGAGRRISRLGFRRTTRTRTVCERETPRLSGMLKKEHGPYVLGADTIGRDLLSRLIYGARISLMVMAVALITGTIVGTALGLIAGYFGGIIDEVINAPGGHFLRNSIRAHGDGRRRSPWGQDLTTMMVMLALLTWSGFVRNVRGEVLSLRERDYVALAMVAGASLPSHSGDAHTSRRSQHGCRNRDSSVRAAHPLPEAFLSFIGAGIPPPNTDLGRDDCRWAQLPA